MGKIDPKAIEKLDLDTSPEAAERFDATLKRAMRMPTTERENQLLREWCEKQGW